MQHENFSMADIEYFYSTHSAFAYLGSARFMGIAKSAGRRIVHKPVELNEVVPAAGSTPFARRSAAYREYYFMREIQRWSEERQAPVMGRPAHHNNDVTLANCMVVAGVVEGLDMDSLAHELLEAHWRHDADLADAETLQRIGFDAGYDGSALIGAAASTLVRQAYEANTREAIERSVFGSPTYFVDGDMFYGQDRLEMVERALDKPYSRQWSGSLETPVR